MACLSVFVDIPFGSPEKVEFNNQIVTKKLTSVGLCLNIFTIFFRYN